MKLPSRRQTGIGHYFHLINSLSQQCASQTLDKRTVKKKFYSNSTPAFGSNTKKKEKENESKNENVPEAFYMHCTSAVHCV